MPPTGKSGSFQLSIQLLNPETILRPGSVILGHIVRKRQLVAPSATIRVRLYGRAKAKLVVERSNNRSSYRSRFNFWPDAAVSDVVHQGPIHVAPGGVESWPFALALPTHTDAKSVNNCGGSSEKEACYLQAPGGVAAAAGISEQPLPPSFYFEHLGFSKNWHGFVEYWISAELVVEGAKRNIIEVTLPLRVFSPPVPSPITEFRLLTRKKTGCVSSQRLLPGMEEADLSFKQKTQKFFGSSKVPTFHYTLNVQSPTIIQLGSQSAIPFLLHLSPNREKTSDAIQDVTQVVTLKYVDLVLQTRTSISCPGTLEPHQEDETRDLCLARTANFPKKPIVLPSGSKEVPIDLGTMLNARVNDSGQVVRPPWYGPRSAVMHDPTILPTMVTYCVKIEHALQWEVQISVAGETWTCVGNNKVHIVAPSENMASETAESSRMGASLISPSPEIEEVPAYDEPSEAAPAYEEAPDSTARGQKAV